MDCHRTFPIVDGIPVLVVDIAAADRDELGHARADGAHKRSQAEHFDHEVVEEFEVTRPRGTPRLYEFLIREKLRRATSPIGPGLIGASALTVCGGSGMDAELLERQGADVVVTDISLGAARRTRERARRYGLRLTAIVADIENLPFADASFDLVLVHDGLHHLEGPDRGLAEMARVARRWVSVTEPARAAITSLAIRGGFARAQEDAGNAVYRLDANKIADALRRSGFRPLVARRYAMYYQHEPGPVSDALSRPWIYPAARWGWRVANAIFGRIGNKMVVVAERQHPSGRGGTWWS
jgi:ubiquinone/menaquinone biosynthesis C-methylase UbiE